MKLKILGCGTSTGVPLPSCSCNICTSEDERNKRTRCSAVLSLPDGLQILIDAGPDLRQQALRWNITRLDAVLYTHGHTDHIIGTDELRCFSSFQKKTLPCYATKITLKRVRECFPYVFHQDPDWQGGVTATLSFKEINSQNPFLIEGYKIIPFPMQHGNTVVTGFRCGPIAYAPDCKIMPEESIEALTGIEYLVLDGLREKPHPSHLSISEACELAQKIGAKKTYLTHMAHNVDYKEATAQLPPGVELCYDGLEISI